MPKFIYATNNYKKKVYNINAYLVEADDIFIEKRSVPLSNCEKMVYGSEPREGGFLLLNAEERQDLINETPEAEAYIKRFVSADDYINSKLRYCLWLIGADISVIRKSRIIMERLKKCSEFRKNSKQKQAHEAANTASIFASPR